MSENARRNGKKERSEEKEVLIEMQTELMECQMCHVYFNISFLKALQVSILVCLHMNEPFKRFLLNSAPVSEKNKAKECRLCEAPAHALYSFAARSFFIQFNFIIYLFHCITFVLLFIFVIYLQIQ